MTAMSPHPPRTVQWAFLGRVPYAEALAMQLAAREEVKRGTGPERLFLLEHPHVYTLGRNAEEADVLSDPLARAALGIEVYETDRGGQVTYHGPGQLVGYPILNLSPDRRDIRRYVADLEDSLVRLLAGYGVPARVREGTEYVGVWTGPEDWPRKIASIGVHLSRWVTTHGFALNVEPDLAFFGGIVACGLPGVALTSIAREAGSSPPLAEVAARYAPIFAETFGRELAPMELPAAVAAPP